MTGANKVMTPAEWGMLLALSLVWGGSFFFVGVAVRELPPLTIVALRVSLAALILWACAPALGLVIPRRREVVIALLGMGLMNNVIPFCLIVWGQTQLASGLASILNATTPLFTVVAGHFLSRDERMTPLRAMGALCGLLGVAALVGPTLVEGLGGGVMAELAILGAATSYALASLFGRRFRRLGLSPIATATGQVTASSLLLVPIALLVDRPWTLPLPGVATCAAIAGIASLSTSLAYILYFRILAGAGATNVVLVTLLAPVSSILLGAIFLRERLEPRHFVGLALIAIGLACIDGRAAQAMRIAKSAGRPAR
jgi:drug/metabolite transporter (DMT)-like permease